uniref:Phospholipase A2 n=1 Tax=Clastoptera arizonana TaxID=38151 RepID=A0A1B6DBG7_9HEMI
MDSDRGDYFHVNLPTYFHGDETVMRTMSVDLQAGSYVPLTLLGVVLLLLAPAVVAGQRGFGISGDTSPYKGYSGFRLRQDSTRMVYYHEQTIAIVELGEQRRLYNCELIEVYKPIELKKALQNLTAISMPYPVSFKEMMDLMLLCHQVSNHRAITAKPNIPRNVIDKVNPVTLLSGILPGTKWCGAGDIASDYFDLGADAILDKCCRTHDLCPVKVKAYATRYNLTNTSLYTKSHCTCDSFLYNCLKETHNPTADIMGSIYFNILRVPCVRTGTGRANFQRAKKY